MPKWGGFYVFSPTIFVLSGCLQMSAERGLKNDATFSRRNSNFLHKLKELIVSSKLQIFFVDFSLEKIVLFLGHCIANQTKILGRYCIYL